MSPFDETGLQRWRGMSVEKGRQLGEDIEPLRKDANGIQHDGPLPIHRADAGSDGDQQERQLFEVDNEEDLLWQVERAIQKIDTGKPLPFGICEFHSSPNKDLTNQEGS